MFYRIETLLNSQDPHKVSRYFHHMDDLLAIRRSTASTLQKDRYGNIISLRSMMPLHEYKTVELKYRPEEAAEMQWSHRAHAR